MQAGSPATSKQEDAMSRRSLMIQSVGALLSFNLKGFRKALMLLRLQQAFGLVEVPPGPEER